MAWSQSDLDALDRAIADGKGAIEIQFSDRLVRFNTISEMLKLRAVMQQAINAAAGISRAVRYGATSKGTC